MMLGNILLFLVIAAIIGGALAKLISDKKKGIACSGCPYSRAGADGCSCSSQPATDVTLNNCSRQD